MRDPTTFKQNLQKIKEAQGALRLQSEAALAGALRKEHEREAALANAQDRYDEALGTWRGTLGESTLDPALLSVFAEAAPRSESERKRALDQLERARSGADVERDRHARAIHRARHAARLQKLARKRLLRRKEERVLSALEERIAYVRSTP